jgi:PDZ domain-containing secreted protein
MKSNSQTKLPKFQSKQLFEKASSSKSTNIMKFILVLLLVMTVNQISYSQTNLTPDTCTQWEAFGEIGNNALLSFRSCQETDNNTAYFEIKNESNYDVKLSYVLHFNNEQTITGDAFIELDDKIRISSKQCIDSIGKGIASWELINIKFKGQP